MQAFSPRFHAGDRARTAIVVVRGPSRAAQAKLRTARHLAQVHELPRAILFDLDDTIPSAYGNPQRAWQTVTEAFGAQLAPLAPRR